MLDKLSGFFTMTLIRLYWSTLSFIFFLFVPVRLILADLDYEK